jgi:hypothetical protein
MPRVGAFDLPEGSAAAALYGGADPPCNYLIKQYYSSYKNKNKQRQEYITLSDNTYFQ